MPMGWKWLIYKIGCELIAFAKQTVRHFGRNIDDENGNACEIRT